MKKEMSEYYSIEDNCFKLLREAREVFGDSRTTQELYESMETQLAFALMYCPRDIVDLVQATVMEAGIRRQFFSWS